MTIKHFNEGEYYQKKKEPMRYLETEEFISLPDLRDYEAECIREFDLHKPLRREGVKIDEGTMFAHVLMSFDLPDTFLVMIIDVDSGSIQGHCLTDSTGKYKG